MSYIFCIGCGSKISSNVTECPMCGYDNLDEQDDFYLPEEEGFDEFIDAFFSDDELDY